MANAGASEVSDGPLSAGILSLLSPEVRKPRSLKRRPPTRPTHKRQHCSTESVELLSMPLTKVSVIPPPRVQSVDRVSSASAGDCQFFYTYTLYFFSVSE